MLTHRVARFDAVLRYSELVGADPPIVFVTGMGLAAAETFLPALPATSLRSRRMLFVDTFGSGYSDAPSRFGYGLSDQAYAVADLLRAADATGCVLVGFSAGGSIAVVLADEHPGLVARLVVAETNLAQGGGSISPWIARHGDAEFVEVGHSRLLDRFGAASGPGPAALRAFFARAAPLALLRTARALVEPLERDIRRRLTELPIPRAYIRGGSLGSEFCDDDGSLQAAGVELFTVSDAGHLLSWEDPRGFARALQASIPDPPTTAG